LQSSTATYSDQAELTAAGQIVSRFGDRGKDRFASLSWARNSDRAYATRRPHQRVAALFCKSRADSTGYETWRLHYAATLEKWLENFETCWDGVCELYGDNFVRM
jgi:hypothetical protein